MKLIFTLVFLLSTLCAFSHEGSSIREGGGTLAPTAVVVSFSSLGSGIDSVTYQLVMKLAQKYEREGNLESFVKENRRMEGEVAVCLDFYKFETAQDFIVKLYNSISKDPYQRTEFYESMSCKDLNDY